MKVFITGGAGFIGSWIVEKLVSRGHEVTVYDNFSSGLWENLEPVKQKIKVIEGDICDLPSLTKAMAGHDVVSHQAAQLEITTAIDTPDHDVKVNIIGSLNVLQAMKTNAITKAVFASSACVYGNLNEYLVKEDIQLMPNWEYGVSKLAVEKYCDIFCNYEGMHISSLRYGIVYGEREWYGRVLTIFIKRALENKDLILFDNGNNIRDFIHVQDVANLNVSLIESKWFGHNVLNVSTGKATSTLEVASTIQQIAADLDHKKINIIFESIREGQFSEHVEGRKRLPRELNIMSLDNHKAGKLFEWKPEVHITEGFKREYQWLKNNMNRWKKMSY